MDAFTQLAVMTKAKRVFESDDTFLSFPALSPISYDPGELAFAMPGGMTAEGLAAMSEFARITNAIPRGAIAPQDEGEYLWDVYGDVLETAELAGGDLSPAEAARYQEAMSFLYVETDGVRSDSDVYATYKQYRDAHIAALEDYKNRQVTAEFEEDAAARARWRDEDEPRVRDEVAHCEERWVTEGRKAAVDDALQVEQACAARAPSLIWDDWKTSFVADLDTQTDTSLINFATTGFSPYDFVDDAWPRFTLTRSEMARLVEAAPPELIGALGSSAHEDIEGVSFEYRSVAVTRSWFKPALLKSRIWRLPAAAEALAEGDATLRGRCPAYIAAIVFARNFSVERRRPAVARANGGGQDHRPDPRAPRPRPVVRDHRDNGRASRPVNRDRQVVARARRAGPSPYKVRIVSRSTSRPVARVQTAARPVRVNSGFTSIQRRELPSRTAPIAPPVTSAATPSPALTVVAFVCKRLARCPDPDPRLTWSAS
jgi:hypothetical protein